MKRAGTITINGRPSTTTRTPQVIQHT